MKTVEEKIQQAWEQLGNTSRASENFKQGFISGHTEANKWISVEEELPPLERGKHYLCKVEYSFPKNCKVIICEFYEDTKTFRCESSDEFVNDVTHWRPIN